MYYHVAGPQWQKGAPLYCWDILQELGVEVAWKWDGEPGEYDHDVVCLFDNLRDAVEYADEFGGVVLQVWMPEWFRDGESYTWYSNTLCRYIQSRLGGPNVEGYRYITEAVPAEWLHRVPARQLEQARSA